MSMEEDLVRNLWWARTMEMHTAEQQLEELLKDFWIEDNSRRWAVVSKALAEN